MPRQYCTKHGVEQTRRPASALFPPALEMAGSRFTLERDGMHIWLNTDQSIIQGTVDRGNVASLIDWLEENGAWIAPDRNSDDGIEDMSNACGYCFRNLTHTNAQHQQCVEQAKARRAHLEIALKGKVFEKEG